MYHVIVEDPKGPKPGRDKKCEWALPDRCGEYAGRSLDIPSEQPIDEPTKELTKSSNNSHPNPTQSAIGPKYQPFLPTSIHLSDHFKQLHAEAHQYLSIVLIEYIIVSTRKGRPIRRPPTLTLSSCIAWTTFSICCQITLTKFASSPPGNRSLSPAAVGAALSYSGQRLEKKETPTFTGWASIQFGVPLTTNSILAEFEGL